MKKKIQEKCKQIVNEKLKFAQNRVAHLKSEIELETKCSCGDKHETARSILHIEQEKSGSQFTDAMKMKKAIDEINILKPNNHVNLGSLVYTNKGLFFIAISLGKIIVNDQPIYVVSLKSPIGKAFLNKQSGDIITFNSTTYTIKDIK